jgi:hypothetical protein
MTGAERSPEGDFVEKWFACEPEMRLAEVFVPVATRPLHRRWGAFLLELRQARFELSDPVVTTAKLGWWGEELIALADGRARHPLTQAFPASAPWLDLARRLSPGGDGGERPATVDHALRALMPLANAVIAVEASLFGSEGGDPEARALAVHWLSERLDTGLAAEDGARLPMTLLARHAVTASELAAQPRHPALRDWAAQLADALPSRLTGRVALRHQRLAFDRGRLSRLRRGRGLSRPTGFTDLLRAWSATRQSLKPNRLR